MKKIIKKYFLTETFKPTLFSVFFNPFFFIRKGIYNNILTKSSKFKGKVLDFGCGSKPYESLFTNVDEYIGVDFEPIEASKNSKIDVYYDGKNLPFPDNHFDCIFCTEVLEHLFNNEEILPELHRVLKNGGIGLFTFPFAWPEHAQPFDYARYTSFSSKYIFEKYNFKIKSIEKSGNFVEVIFQFIIFYLYSILPTQNNSIKTFVLLPFTFFVNLTGLIFSFILPTQKDLYFNNIVEIEKE